MKITLVVTDCRDKISDDCTKTFQRKVQRGRPQVNCDNCKAVKAPVVSAAVANRNRKCACGELFTVSAGRGRKPSKCNKCRESATVATSAAKRNRKCGCGADFTVPAGKGRKSSKCDKCKEAGIVYRSNDDGEIETVRKQTLVEEQREIREQRGRETAERLVMLMAPLLKKADRKVIVH